MILSAYTCQCPLRPYCQHHSTCCQRVYKARVESSLLLVISKPLTHRKTTMSLLLNALLLATLLAIITVSSGQDQGSTAGECPHVEVLRGKDGRDGRDGVKGEKGDSVHSGEKGEPGEPGEKGNKDIHGIQGPIGILGPHGPAGEKGMRGDPGLQGPQGEQGVQGPPSGGVTYTRWGRTNCPTGQGSELVYAGRAGGTHYQHSGGGANHLCMPDDPDHLQYQSGVQGWSHITGVEYWHSGLPPYSSVNYNNVPCAVCYVATRSVSLMIPAKTQCPTHWTLEYIGYLMTAKYNQHRTMYECVDKDPELVPGLHVIDPRGLFYPVEPSCISLSCPPYDAQKELICAVCTR